MASMATSLRSAPTTSVALTRGVAKLVPLQLAHEDLLGYRLTCSSRDAVDRDATVGERVRAPSVHDPTAIIPSMK